MTFLFQFTFLFDGTEFDKKLLQQIALTDLANFRLLFSDDDGNALSL